MNEDSTQTILNLIQQVLDGERLAEKSFQEVLQAVWKEAILGKNPIDLGKQVLRVNTIVSMYLKFKCILFQVIDLYVRAYFGVADEKSIELYSGLDLTRHLFLIFFLILFTKLQQEISGKTGKDQRRGWGRENEENE